MIHVLEPLLVDELLWFLCEKLYLVCYVERELGTFLLMMVFVFLYLPTYIETSQPTVAN